jgi:hypothetical protein
LDDGVGLWLSQGISMLRVMSANRLTDGIIVYLGPQGEWLSHIGAASRLTSEEACEAAMAKARAAVAANLILDPLIVDVTEGAEGLHAKSLRNAIRAAGPSVNFKGSSPAA